MQSNQADLLPEDIIEINTKKRKQLLPVWIKIFMWLFLAFGLIAPLALIFGLSGFNFQLSLYGFFTNEPFSIIGMGIVILFLLKGIVSLGLLMEKSWAVKLGLVDAALGILICSYVMVYSIVKPVPGSAINFRLELVALIPYFVKFKKIKIDWENTVEV